MTDRELLDRITGKDRKAFDVLYHRYERLFYRWVFSRLNDYDAAGDLLQNFWIAVWNSPESIRTNEKDSAKDYLLRNLTYRILKQVQREMTRLEIPDDELVNQQMFDFSYTHISEELYVKEILQLIDKVLENLPPLNRKIYELRYKKNFSVKETADILSINEKTVRNGTSLALAKIRNELKIAYGDGVGEPDKLMLLLPLVLFLLEK